MGVGLSAGEERLRLAYAQAHQYAEELRALYVERRATRLELDQKIAELEASQQQLLAYAHDLATLNRQLNLTYMQTLTALARTVDRRDGMTGDHCVRVAGYSRAVGAMLLGDDGDVLRKLEYGALLHDIGKIAVPDAILRKAGPLDEEEWAMMRQHPILGCGILEGVGFLKDSLPIVRHHHERFDGQGYPDGLCGDEIPLGARVFAVADAFDAMTSDRHYRAALGLDETLAELRRHSGTQFDPGVVATFESEAERLLDLPFDTLL
ncbi:MAG: HD domain-containing protein [Chloroflexota bacterium]